MIYDWNLFKMIYYTNFSIANLPHYIIIRVTSYQDPYLSGLCIFIAEHSLTTTAVASRGWMGGFPLPYSLKNFWLRHCTTALLPWRYIAKWILILQFVRFFWEKIKNSSNLAAQIRAQIFKINWILIFNFHIYSTFITIHEDRSNG